LAHRERWSTDDQPETSALRRWSTAEHEIYNGLVGDVLRPKV
jgi:hypothetical protein